jgi:hypothetical protein
MIGVVSPGESPRDLVRRVDELAACVAVLSLATRGALESRVSRVVVFLDCVPAGPLDCVFAISPIIDDFHQAANGFRLQTAELLPEIASEQTALESVDDQFLVDVVAGILEGGPPLDVLSQGFCPSLDALPKLFDGSRPFACCLEVGDEQPNQIVPMIDRFIGQVPEPCSRGFLEVELDELHGGVARAVMQLYSC